ncbi:MAG: enoyl-CoA hydratase [Rhodobacterales bacterium]|nr:MAG: enoyl-CoA hydratase [Rhodobacterales bacterium]
MSAHIRVEQDGAVVWVTIDRQDNKNALTQEMYGALADALVAYGADDSQRVMVITGAGDMFTAGNDLGDFATGDRADEEPPVWRFLGAIRDCEKPLIAAVNGAGVGVGLTLLLHCDLVCMALTARVSAPFARLALVPEAASSLLLPATVGMAMANDILLAGRELTAAEAVQFGLASRIYPDGELMAEVGALAKAMAGASPRSLAGSKRLIRMGREEVAERMLVESKLFRDRLLSPDFAESIAAMKEKRAPIYE